MEIDLQCRHCAAQWNHQEEPRALLQITCPQCGRTADLRSSEDLASTLEDALHELWRLSQDVHLKIRLDTQNIPEDFQPPLTPGTLDLED